MSALDFVEMTVLEVVLSGVIACLVCLSFFSIGHFFYKGKNILMKSLTGMAVVASIVLIFVSYAASFAKYVLFISCIISITLSIILLIRKKVSIKEVFGGVLPILVFFVFFCMKILLWMIDETGFIKFNCHMTCYAAMSEEIFKADYFSRLRILDVYPYTWGKNHFFNTCMDSIPLAIFPKKNFVSFLVSKYITISVYFAAIFSVLREKYGRKQSVLFLVSGIGTVTIVFYHGFISQMFVQGYSSMLLMVVLWILLLRKDYSNATIFSLIFAISTSRELIPGIAFFIFSLTLLFFANEKNIANLLKFEIQRAVACLVIGTAGIVMLISGKSVADESVIAFDFFASSIFSTWIGVLPLGGLYYNGVRGVGEYNIDSEFVILAIYIYLIIRSRGLSVVMTMVRKLSHMWIWLSLIFLSVLGILYVEEFHRLVKIRSHLPAFFLSPVFFLVIFVVPVFAVYMNIQKHMKVPLVMYIVVSFLQFVVFTTETGICNYQMLFIVLIITLIGCLYEDNVFDFKTKGFKQIVLPIMAAGMLYLVLYDWHHPFFGSLSDGHYLEIPIREVPYSDSPFEYYDESDADLARLNAYKGNRVHYNVPIDAYADEFWKNSISMRMAVEE